MELYCERGGKTWTEDVTYDVTYSHLEQGLIIYNFHRSAIKRDEQKKKNQNQNKFISNPTIMLLKKFQVRQQQSTEKLIIFQLKVKPIVIIVMVIS